MPRNSNDLAEDPVDLEVVVTSIVVEAVDVVSVEIARTDKTPFPVWQAGAHIDMRLNSGIERQFSLCGDQNDRDIWKVAVLREPQSRGGSEWVHTRLAVGDVVGVTGPRNNFGLVDADSYLLVAGGIGITPLLAMVRELDRSEADWRLLYGGRQERSMAFLDELSSYGDRVEIRPQDTYGLLDLGSFLGTPKTGTAVYCCGPELLLEAVEASCKPWPRDTLHVERFHPRPGALEGDNNTFEVELAGQGVTLQIAADQTIVEALDAAGIDVATSCREGTCGTCETRVIAGIPDHRDSFLTDDEKADNATMMICCSRSLTPTLVLDI